MREANIGYLRGSEAQEAVLIRSGENELATMDAITQSRNHRNHCNHAITQSSNHAIGAITQSRNQRYATVLIGSRELMLLLALHVKVEGGHRPNLNTHVRRLHVHLDKLDLAVILLRELSTEVGTARSTGLSMNPTPLGLMAS